MVRRHVGQPVGILIQPLLAPCGVVDLVLIGSINPHLIFKTTRKALKKTCH